MAAAPLVKQGMQSWLSKHAAAGAALESGGEEGTHEHAATLAADELERVGVLLLRHERRPRGVRVGALHVAELVAGVDDEVLGKAREVVHVQRHRKDGLQHKVAVRDGVHAVGHHACHAELLHGQRCDVKHRSCAVRRRKACSVHHACARSRRPHLREEVAVHLEGVACECAGAKRQHGDAWQHVTHALVVALPRRAVAHEPVAPANGLRGLQVREAWHEDGGLRLGAPARHLDQLPQRLARTQQLLVQPQAVVRGHLVVARPARLRCLGIGMCTYLCHIKRMPRQSRSCVMHSGGHAPSRVQLAADGAHELREAALIGGVDVLVAALHLERARLPLRAHLI